MVQETSVIFPCGKDAKRDRATQAIVAAQPLIQLLEDQFAARSAATAMTEASSPSWKSRSDATFPASFLLKSAHFQMN
jgi:hypothetical protein